MKTRRSASASMILFACALSVSAACQTKDEQDNRRIQLSENAHREAVQLWQRLLRKYRSSAKAATSPEIKEVISILKVCKNYQPCSDLQNKIADAADKGEKAARENEERMREYRHTAAAPDISEPASDADAEAASGEQEQADGGLPDAAEGAASAPEEIPEVPAQGMEETAFQKAFGDCFEHFSELEVSDVGTGEVLSLIKTEECQKKLPGFQDSAVLLVNGSIESVRPMAELQPVRTILYEGREITPEQKNCLLKNYQLEKEGRSAEKTSCLPGDDPYGIPAESDKDTVVEIESI